MFPRFDELHDRQFEHLRQFTGRSFTSITDFLAPSIRRYRDALHEHERSAFDLHLSERLIFCWQQISPGGYDFFATIRIMSKTSPARHRSLLRSLTAANPSQSLDRLVEEMTSFADPTTLAQRFMSRRHGRECFLDGLPYADTLYVDDDPKLQELWLYASALEPCDVIVFSRTIAEALRSTGIHSSDNAFSSPSVAVRMLGALELVIDVISAWDDVPCISFDEAVSRLALHDPLRQWRMALTLLQLRDSWRRVVFSGRVDTDGLEQLDRWSGSDWQALEKICTTLEHRILQQLHLQSADNPEAPPYSTAPKKLVWRLLKTDLAHLIEHLVASNLVEPRGVNEWVARNIVVRNDDESLSEIDASRFADLRRGLRRSYATAPSSEISPTILLIRRPPSPAGSTGDE